MNPYLRLIIGGAGTMTCKVDDCNSNAQCKDMCGMHYARMARRGSTDPQVRTSPKTHCAVPGCDKGSPINRLAWELMNGPIPEGMFVCHHCDTPLCCEPTHLFLGSNAANVADMMAKGRHRTNGSENKTHCPQGHPYSGVNLYTYKGGRSCIQCKRDRYLLAKQAKQ